MSSSAADIDDVSATTMRNVTTQKLFSIVRRSHGTNYHGSHHTMSFFISFHEKLKPYQCDECGKSFGRKNVFQTHKATKHMTQKSGFWGPTVPKIKV